MKKLLLLVFLVLTSFTYADTRGSFLEEIQGVTLLSGASPSLSAPGSTIFEKDGLDAMESVPLIENKIQTHIDEHQRDGHNAIRVSTHFYNNTGEIDSLLSALS